MVGNEPTTSSMWPVYIIVRYSDSVTTRTEIIRSGTWITTNTARAEARMPPVHRRPRFWFVPREPADPWMPRADTPVLATSWAAAIRRFRGNT